MSYQLLRTDKFNDQLNDIIQYIANDSGDVDTALNCLDEIEEAILRLRNFPESGSNPRYSLLKKQGYRVLIVSRYLVFYKIDKTKSQVLIYAIVDGRREYLALI